MDKSLWIDFTERADGKDRRKLDHNTYLERLPGNAWAVRLHATNILTVTPDGTVTARNGGYQTVTTKDRLNNFLPGGWGIGQAKRVWYWFYKGERLAEFTDGDRLVWTPTGYALDITNKTRAG